MRKQGPSPIRHGYTLVGWCKQFRHHKSKRVIRAPAGTSFPIWRRVSAK